MSHECTCEKHWPGLFWPVVQLHSEEQAKGMDLRLGQAHQNQPGLFLVMAW